MIEITGLVIEFVAELRGPGKIREGTRQLFRRVDLQRVRMGVVNVKITNQKKRKFNHWERN